MTIAKPVPNTSRADKRIFRFCAQQLPLLTIASLLLIAWCLLRASTSTEHIHVISLAVKDHQHMHHHHNESRQDEFDRLQYLETMFAEAENAPKMDANLSLSMSLNGTDHEHNVILHRRVKRGVLDLASMIKCVTGCNPFLYKNYGCFCGVGGEGYPVDGIDRCCYMHDNCYSRADCHQALVYFKPYKWTCMQSPYMRYGRAKCGLGSSSLCALQLCECDRKFAKCLSQYRCPHSKASCDIHKNIIIGK